MNHKITVSGGVSLGTRDEPEPDETEPAAEAQEPAPAPRTPPRRATPPE